MGSFFVLGLSWGLLVAVLRPSWGFPGIFLGPYSRMGSRVARTRPQERPKKAPRRPQDGPKKAPRKPQEGPKTGMPQEDTKNAPRRPQACHKKATRRLQIINILWVFTKKSITSPLSKTNC